MFINCKLALLTGCQKWSCRTVSGRIQGIVDLLPQSPSSLSSPPPSFALSRPITCLYFSSSNYHHSTIDNFSKCQITFYFIQFSFISNIYIVWPKVKWKTAYRWIKRCSLNSEDYNTMNSCACFLLVLSSLSDPSPGNSLISVQLRTNFVDSWSLFSGKKKVNKGMVIYNKRLEFFHYYISRYWGHLRCAVIRIPKYF